MGDGPGDSETESRGVCSACWDRQQESRNGRRQQLFMAGE